MQKNRHDFSLIPQVNFRRSKFTMNHGNKTSFNVGELVPLDIMEVIPGDTFSTKMSAVVRASTAFIRPIMDNLFMDIYHFYIPNRLLYNKSEQVFGKANPSMYVDEDLEKYPVFNSCTISSKSVGDYLGLPLGLLPVGLSVLPYRAFALVYNTWFRNENIIDETYVSTGDRSVNEVPNDREWSPTNYCGKLPHVGKKKDYFTSALPRPQKGLPVSLPLGVSAPVESLDSINFLRGRGSGSPIALVKGTSSVGDLPSYAPVVGAQTAYSNNILESLRLDTDLLYANLTEATSVDVNDLRFAFQLQKMLERDSLYGSRYNEYLLAHYGVSSPDSRLQLPEFLGGGRIPVQIQQVAQTSQGTEDSPLAQVGGFSLSTGSSSFVKGFVEHGFILTVGCVRQIHTYQQGINKMWFRKERNDFYDPLFANLGEQPIYQSELYGNVLELKGNVFGYNEAWAEYRYKPNMITGQMRSNAPLSQDIWHLADKYNSAPTLTDTFINENSDNIDRVLTAPSSSIDNFIMDMYFETDAIRVMPTYSVPGLVDHH